MAGPTLSFDGTKTGFADGTEIFPSARVRYDLILLWFVLVFLFVFVFA